MLACIQASAFVFLLLHTVLFSSPLPEPEMNVSTTVLLSFTKKTSKKKAKQKLSLEDGARLN